MLAVRTALPSLLVALSAGCPFPVDIGSFGVGTGALEGDPCAADTDCDDGLVCADGACAAPDAGCAADADCDAPQVCVQGACERPACATDADCDGGLCDRDGLCSAQQSLGPVIVISETGQGMGEVVVGDASVGDTEIDNFGDADVVVDAAHFEGDGADQFFIASGVVDNGDGTVSIDALSSQLDAPITIAPDGSSTLFEVFQPTRLGDFTVDLVVHSNDPATPELRVALRGVGVDQPTRP